MRNPWWLPPFFGRVPVGVDASQLRLLGLVILGLLCDSYDLSLVNSTISRVANELGIAVSDVGFYAAAVRLGGIASFAIVPMADRLGRRRVFLATLLGGSLGSLATALAPTPLAWALAQILTRGSLLALSALAAVILSEEMPAAHRAWALGISAAVAGFGYGVGMGGFAFVDSLPFGWRALYALPVVVPLLVLAFLRRALGETRRFSEQARPVAPAPGSRTGGLRAWAAPLVGLVRRDPRRAAVIGAAGLAAAVGSIPFYQYLIYLVEDVHGWTPGQFTLLILGAGLVGTLGNPVAGRLIDRIGRRRVGVLALCSQPLAVALLYNGPDWALPPVWAAIVFIGTASDVVLRVLATELFPTAHRSTAVGWFTLLQSIGWVIGLLAVGFAHVGLADLGLVMPVASSTLAVAGLLLLLLPETRSLELEAISGGAGGSAQGAALLP